MWKPDPRGDKTLFFPTTETADISAPGPRYCNYSFFLENIVVLRYFKLGLMWSDNLSWASHRGGANSRGWFNAKFRQIFVTCDYTSAFFRNLVKSSDSIERVTKIRSLSSKKPSVYVECAGERKICVHTQKRKYKCI